MEQMTPAAGPDWPWVTRSDPQIVDAMVSADLI